MTARTAEPDEEATARRVFSDHAARLVEQMRDRDTRGDPLVRVSRDEIVRAADLLERMFLLDLPRQVYCDHHLDDDDAVDAAATLSRSRPPILGHLAQMRAESLSSVLGAASPGSGIDGSVVVPFAAAWMPKVRAHVPLKVVEREGERLTAGLLARLVCLAGDTAEGLLDARYRLGPGARRASAKSVRSVALAIAADPSASQTAVCAFMRALNELEALDADFLLRALCRGERSLFRLALATLSDREPKLALRARGTRLDALLDDCVADVGQRALLRFADDQVAANLLADELLDGLRAAGANGRIKETPVSTDLGLSMTAETHPFPAEALRSLDHAPLPPRDPSVVAMHDAP